MFSVRIVTTDHYLSKPIRGLDVCYNEFLGTDINRVPVIRVFGATPSGQKTCMHIHGIFPYLYVPYDGAIPVEQHCRQVANSLNKALNVASRKVNSEVQHVYKVTVVSGVPFYGYHDDEQQFLKIYFFNPQMIKKAADLLLGGAVMNKVYQPYESHIPYLLQSFIDYNLYGMNMLNVGGLKFRCSDPDVVHTSQNSSISTPDIDALNDSARWSSFSTKKWDMENIPGEMLLDIEIEKQSTCELEVDVVAADILNRLEVGANIGTNPGLAALWEDERQRRRERGDSSQLTPPGSPDRGHISWTDAEARLQERLSEILTILQPHMEDSDNESIEGDSDDSDIIPSSQLQLHVPSDLDDTSDSQDTIIFDDEHGAYPAIVNEASILRVMSSGHSFLADEQQMPSTPRIGSQEKDLARMLAELADGSGDSQLASQVASGVAASEEQDCVLSCPAANSDDEQEGSPEEKDDAETLEMSQRVWEETEPQEMDTEEPDPGDTSWNHSQWLALEQMERDALNKDLEEETIPQFDGAGDEHTSNEERHALPPPKKRQVPGEKDAEQNQASIKPTTNGTDKSKEAKRSGSRDNIFSALLGEKFFDKTATGAGKQGKKQKGEAKGASVNRKVHESMLRGYIQGSELANLNKNKSKYPVMLSTEFECGGLSNLPEHEIGQFYKERPGVKYTTYCSLYRQQFPSSLRKKEEPDDFEEDSPFTFSEPKKTYTKKLKLDRSRSDFDDYFDDGASKKKKKKPMVEREINLFEDLDEFDVKKKTTPRKKSSDEFLKAEEPNDDQPILVPNQHEKKKKPDQKPSDGGKTATIQRGQTPGAQSHEMVVEKDVATVPTIDQPEDQESEHKVSSKWCPLIYKVHAQYYQGQHIAHESNAFYSGKVKVRKRDRKKYNLKQTIGHEKVVLHNLSVLLTKCMESSQIGMELDESAALVEPPDGQFEQDDTENMQIDSDPSKHSSVKLKKNKSGKKFRAYSEKVEPLKMVEGPPAQIIDISQNKDGKSLNDSYDVIVFTFDEQSPKKMDPVIRDADQFVLKGDLSTEILTEVRETTAGKTDLVLEKSPTFTSTNVEQSAPPVKTEKPKKVTGKFDMKAAQAKLKETKTKKHLPEISQEQIIGDKNESPSAFLDVHKNEESEDVFSKTKQRKSYPKRKKKRDMGLITDQSPQPSPSEKETLQKKRVYPQSDDSKSVKRIAVEYSPSTLSTICPLAKMQSKKYVPSVKGTKATMESKDSALSTSSAFEAVPENEQPEKEISVGLVQDNQTEENIDETNDPRKLSIRVDKLKIHQSTVQLKAFLESHPWLRSRIYVHDYNEKPGPLHIKSNNYRLANGLPKKAKKQPSYHKRLSAAFTKTNKRRRKSFEKSRFLTTLSDLHNAIVEGSDTKDSSSADNEDYSDSMFNMSYMSPKVSTPDKGSPPQAVSPTDEVESAVISKTCDFPPSLDIAARDSPVLYAVKEAVVKINTPDKTTPPESLPILPGRGNSVSPAKDSEDGRSSPPHLGLPAFMEKSNMDFTGPPELDPVEPVDKHAMPKLSLAPEPSFMPRLDSDAPEGTKDENRTPRSVVSPKQFSPRGKRRGRPPSGTKDKPKVESSPRRDIQLPPVEKPHTRGSDRITKKSTCPCCDGTKHIERKSRKESILSRIEAETLELEKAERRRTNQSPKKKSLVRPPEVIEPLLFTPDITATVVKHKKPPSLKVESKPTKELIKHDEVEKYKQAEELKGDTLVTNLSSDKEEKHEAAQSDIPASCTQRNIESSPMRVEENVQNIRNRDTESEKDKTGYSGVKFLSSSPDDIDSPESPSHSKKGDLATEILEAPGSPDTSQRHGQTQVIRQIPLEDNDSDLESMDNTQDMVKLNKPLKMIPGSPDSQTSSQSPVQKTIFLLTEMAKEKPSELDYEKMQQGSTSPELQQMPRIIPTQVGESFDKSESTSHDISSHLNIDRPRTDSILVDIQDPKSPDVLSPKSPEPAMPEQDSVIIPLEQSNLDMEEKDRSESQESNSGTSLPVKSSSESMENEKTDTMTDAEATIMMLKQLSSSSMPQDDIQGPLSPDIMDEPDILSNITEIKEPESPDAAIPVLQPCRTIPTDSPDEDELLSPSLMPSKSGKVDPRIVQNVQERVKDRADSQELESMSVDAPASPSEVTYQTSQASRIIPLDETQDSTSYKSNTCTDVIPVVTIHSESQGEEEQLAAPASPDSGPASPVCLAANKEIEPSTHIPLDVTDDSTEQKDPRLTDNLPGSPVAQMSSDQGKPKDENVLHVSVGPKTRVDSPVSPQLNSKKRNKSLVPRDPELDAPKQIPLSPHQMVRLKDPRLQHIHGQCDCDLNVSNENETPNNGMTLSSVSMDEGSSVEEISRSMEAPASPASALSPVESGNVIPESVSMAGSEVVLIPAEISNTEQLQPQDKRFDSVTISNEISTESKSSPVEAPLSPAMDSRSSQNVAETLEPVQSIPTEIDPEMPEVQKISYEEPSSPLIETREGNSTSVGGMMDGPKAIPPRTREEPISNLVQNSETYSETTTAIDETDRDHGKSDDPSPESNSKLDALEHDIKVPTVPCSIPLKSPVHEAAINTFEVNQSEEDMPPSSPQEPIAIPFISEKLPIQAIPLEPEVCPLDQSEPSFRASISQVPSIPHESMEQRDFPTPPENVSIPSIAHETMEKHLGPSSPENIETAPAIPQESLEENDGSSSPENVRTVPAIPQETIEQIDLSAPFKNTKNVLLVSQGEIEPPALPSSPISVKEAHSAPKEIYEQSVPPLSTPKVSEVPSIPQEIAKEDKEMDIIQSVSFQMDKDSLQGPLSPKSTNISESKSENIIFSQPIDSSDIPKLVPNIPVDIPVSEENISDDTSPVGEVPSSPDVIRTELTNETQFSNIQVPGSVEETFTSEIQPVSSQVMLIPNDPLLEESVADTTDQVSNENIKLKSLTEKEKVIPEFVQESTLAPLSPQKVSISPGNIPSIPTESSNDTEPGTSAEMNTIPSSPPRSPESFKRAEMTEVPTIPQEAPLSPESLLIPSQDTPSVGEKFYVKQIPTSSAQSESEPSLSPSGSQGKEEIIDQKSQTTSKSGDFQPLLIPQEPLVPENPLESHSIQFESTDSQCDAQEHSSRFEPVAPQVTRDVGYPTSPIPGGVEMGGIRPIPHEVQMTSGTEATPSPVYKTRPVKIIYSEGPTSPMAVALDLSTKSTKPLSENISPTDTPSSPLMNPVMTEVAAPKDDYPSSPPQTGSHYPEEHIPIVPMETTETDEQNYTSSLFSSFSGSVRSVPLTGEGETLHISSQHSESKQKCTEQQQSIQENPEGSILDIYSDSTAAEGKDYSGERESGDSQIVITPASAPPTRESVRESQSEESHQDAYYSRSADVPDRPREVGGRILQIQSPLISDLEEFNCTSHDHGLKYWQDYLLSENYSLQTGVNQIQSSNFSIISEMDKNNSLKAAAMGNEDIVITPCSKPPSFKKVTTWLEAKQTYQLAKKTLNEQHEEKLKVPKIIIQKEKEAEEKSVQFESKVDVTQPDDSESSNVDISYEKSSQSPQASTILTSTQISPNPAVQQKPLFKTPSLVKRRSSIDSTPPQHSTPTNRTSKLESPDLTCTPIPKTSQVTPTDSKPSTSRRRLSKRVSSGTESLRRVLLSTQMKKDFGTPAQLKRDTSQILGCSPNNTHGFKMDTQNFQDAKALHEFQYLTILSVEVHCQTRGDLRPDPVSDPIRALFYCIMNDVPPHTGERQVTGVILVDPDSAAAAVDPGKPSTSAGSATPSTQAKQRLMYKCGLPSLNTIYVSDEQDLLREFLDVVKRWDPDILIGFEIQMLSWGYLLQRAATLNVDLCQMLSRVPGASKDNRFSAEKDEYGADHMSEINISGRIVLNLWRILRHEVTLNVYSFENVMYHVLHRRVPMYSFKTLNQWFEHRTFINKWRTIEYYTTRARGNLQIMDQLDLIGQTSEFARVFGIEFYHVLSRGSQYRVESMMLRIAKPMNYIPVSPSVQQRSRMKAPECIPLTMEPESKFYPDPVVVVDFQSLYPSIMIAYNYCFSTCLGRVESLAEAQNGPFEFGCTSLNVPPKLIKKLGKDVNICPNGAVFVNPCIKKGILPRMVEEILKTRIMVKKSMKEYKDDKTLQRLLHARQLGLKLIANVTFGYTSANFSGRMPCVEIGDSIVRKARETLERAIALVEQTERWGARVVYGDTDSMFIELKGRSKDEAFKIGYEIAEAVTADNPKPVKLKFEKVYMPCVLQTKKRYVGYMYETPDQKDPVYDAKGIETVRRDSCTAVSKILERSIKILFNSRDVSLVKQYVQQQSQKLLEGTASVQDCIFAKEYRGMGGYKPGACVPALELAKKALSADKRSEPRVGERVPYVIVYGTPGLPLIQLVRKPSDLMTDPTLRLNATYYITKQILPPLDRIFSLMGVNVFSWYHDMPKVVKTVPATHYDTENKNKKGTISQYFSSMNCPVCDELTKTGVCAECRQDPQLVTTALNSSIQKYERTLSNLTQICQSCTGSMETDSKCVTLDCPIMFRFIRAQRDVSQANFLRETLAKTFDL